MEVGEIEKKSQECEDSVETARVESSNHLWKKTFRNSPENIASNIGSHILQPIMLTTPTKLKRLKPRPKFSINARLDPSPRKPQDSSTSFSSLLTHWENYSTSAAPMLTPSQLIWVPSGQPIRAKITRKIWKARPVWWDAKFRGTQGD